MFKASANMADNITNAETALSEEPKEAPLNLTFNTELPLFEWLEESGNEVRRERFGVAMDVTQHLIPPEIVLKGANPILIFE